MGDPEDDPPNELRLNLEEGLALLAALEDARDILVATDHLTVVMELEQEITRLSRMLGFDEGGPDGT